MCKSKIFKHNKTWVFSVILHLDLLKFTVKVVTSYKFSLCANKTRVYSVKLGKALSLVSSGSIKFPKKYWVRKNYLAQNFYQPQKNFNTKVFWGIGDFHYRQEPFQAEHLRL